MSRRWLDFMRLPHGGRVDCRFTLRIFDFCLNFSPRRPIAQLAAKISPFGFRGFHSLFHMSGIQLSGLASGYDWSSLVDKLAHRGGHPRRTLQAHRAGGARQAKPAAARPAAKAKEAAAAAPDYPSAAVVAKLARLFVADSTQSQQEKD
jgi:hypothetical protein